MPRITNLDDVLFPVARALAVALAGGFAYVMFTWPGWVFGFVIAAYVLRAVIKYPVAIFLGILLGITH